uniref:Uncharacterized protein n=1 Tax=Manihot esculenta TaxID=3983 RepID=A0A2C9VCG9_MANES
MLTSFFCCFLFLLFFCPKCLHDKREKEMKKEKNIQSRRKY